MSQIASRTKGVSTLLGALFLLLGISLLFAVATILGFLFICAWIVYGILTGRGGYTDRRRAHYNQ